WGDDLRELGIVVEPLHGADDLATAVAGFAPGSSSRTVRAGSAVTSCGGTTKP
ncbi:MAG: DUF3097 family protein, partial [Ilumatobacter sp.]|nr:DUF3097 family protein [Ilumatobacter sp.]